MENIKKFNPTFEIEDWCFDKLRSVESIENYKFYNSSIGYEKHIVTVDKIVGTTHWSYVGRRWIDLPFGMKRFRESYNVDNFLSFVDSEDFTRNGLGYIKYGDCYFTSGGNHRTCQAKFSNLKNITTDVTEFIFDEQMFNTFQFLKNEGLNPIISEGGGGKYYRFNSWKIYMNSEELFFQSFLAIEKFVKQYCESVPNFKNNIIAKFSKMKTLFSYNEDKDYTHLKNSIITHKLQLQKQSA